MSLNWWMDKLRYIRTMYLFLSNKKEQITDRLTTRVNLKCIMLSEKSQTQKATYCVISFIWHSGKDKTLQTENRSLVAVRGVGGGVREQIMKENEGFGAGDGTSLDLDCGAG